MKEQIKELEQKIQKEIWRRQLLDYETLSTDDELHKMQKELKKLNRYDTLQNNNIEQLVFSR